MLRMRQICLVAADLDAAEAELRDVFGLEVCYRDPGVGRFGLRNFLMPIGNAFLEVVAPVQEDTAAGRYLDRRGGDGGYMVIMQSDDVAAARERMNSLGVRIVADSEGEGGAGIQLHPRDVPGAIVSLRSNEGDEDPAGPWSPAGPDWKPAQRTEVVRAMCAAELQSDEPRPLAARWSEVLERPAGEAPSGEPQIALDDAVLRFVKATDGRGEGLGGLDIEVVDRERLLTAAEARDCKISDEMVSVCGVRFRLV